MLRRLRLLVLLVGAALLVATCAPLPVAHVATPKCPGSNVLPCLTPSVCEYDVMRGCQTCRCLPPPFVPPERTSPSSIGP